MKVEQTRSLKAENLMRYATYASVLVAVILVLAKFGAWIMTDAISLLSTLIDSLLEAAASLINLIAVHHSVTPADKEHRFGHGKLQALAGLGQSAFILGSAMFLFVEAGERVLNLKPIENISVGYTVMVVSTILTLILILFQNYVVRRTRSIAISADLVHYKSDLLINLSVIVSLYFATQYDLFWLDPIFAIGIAFFIIFSAYQIGFSAVGVLMDREIPDKDREEIRSLVLSEPGVLGFHQLRTRSSGTQIFIQFHLLLDGNITLREAHDIAGRVEFKLTAAFKNSQVIVHQDPEGLDEKHLTHL